MRSEMPIQVTGDLDLRERRKERVVIVRSIPWAMIAGDAEEKQSQKNHSQSLARIAERGGFSAGEAICVMACIPWEKLGSDETSHRILYAMKATFNRGQRVAEARMKQEFSGGTCSGSET